MYHSGGEGKPVSIVNDKDQLVPYRQLDASRLKIVGSGNWDCRPFLDELFYMPFVEPAINTYDIECPRRFAPDLSRCDPDETLALCRVWDAKNLLRLFHVDEAPVSKKKYVKVFNNYKGPGTEEEPTIQKACWLEFRRGSLLDVPYSRSCLLLSKKS